MHPHEGISKDLEPEAFCLALLCQFGMGRFAVIPWRTGIRKFRHAAEIGFSTCQNSQTC